MRHLLPITLLICAFLCNSVLSAQNQATGLKEILADPDGPKIIANIDDMPEFPGGNEAMYKYLIANVIYPTAALANKVEGKVYVEFIVDVDGSIIDPLLKRGVGYGLDEEALRIVKGMPNWKPGKQDGEAVKVRFIVPVNFKLPKEETEKRK